MNEVISISKRYCENIIVIGDFNINLKIKTNHKFIEYMESFELTLINKLNKDSTNGKTQIDYCFTNMKDFKSDYFESLTSFHKPVWIRKHGILTESHVDEIKQIRIDVPFNMKDLNINDQSDMMEVDGELSSHRYELFDENEQIDMDINFNLEDLRISNQSDIMEIDEQQSPFENYQIVDSDSRRILNRFLRMLGSNNTPDIDQISSQAQVINDLIEKAPFITIQNKDRSVRLESQTEYSVQAFASVYARTRTNGDGNCLYSSLSILNIGSERLTHSMRLLAVNAMINNSDYFRTLCESLDYSYKEQMKRTAQNTIWGGEVQIQALSIALCHPIYSYRFTSDQKSSQYISPNISLQELVDRFNNKTAGGHFKYIGYKSDMNKLAFCAHYNGFHYDALLPFEDNPQQFVPHFDLITMTL